MSAPTIEILGAPVECGASQRGPLMGPAALRTAGLIETLQSLGATVTDHGDASIAPVSDASHPNPALRHLDEIAAWTRILKDKAVEMAGREAFPMFLGGDHSLSHGTVAGIAEYAHRTGRPLFALWIDAHPDFNTFDTTESGNLHGTPVAFLSGLPGFDALLGGPLETPLDPKNIFMIGIRSVDEDEHDLLVEHGIGVADMRKIDEHGVAKLLRPFLERVEAANGLLHASLDVDFLDPGIAPAVGTTVPGGATFREAHLVMEMLHDSGFVTSLDIVELNPFLDERGRTAKLMVDLVASLFGRKVMDRPTRSF